MIPQSFGADASPTWGLGSVGPPRGGPFFVPQNLLLVLSRSSPSPTRPTCPTRPIKHFSILSTRQGATQLAPSRGSQSRRLAGYEEPKTYDPCGRTQMGVSDPSAGVDG